MPPHGRILEYFLPGNTIYMFGYAPPNGHFMIDLRPHYEEGEYSLGEAICLRLIVHMDSYHITFQTSAHGIDWFFQEDSCYSGLLAGRYFIMSIITQTYGYEIEINGYHFATYYHRIPYTETMWINVDQHVRLEPIEYY